MSTDGIKVLQAHPGELQLAISKLQGNPALAQALEARFRTIRGITWVQAEVEQGVVHLRYDPQTLTSLRSLWDLKDAVSTFFPEVSSLELVKLLNQYL